MLAAALAATGITLQATRTHLRTYLEALLRNVDDWARAEQSPASAERDQPQA